MKAVIVKLDHVAEFTNGGAWSDKQYVDHGIPVARISDFVGGTIDLSQCKYLPQSSLTRYKKHQLQEGDLVIAMVGSHVVHPNSVVGRAVIVPKLANGSLLNQNAVRIQPKTDEIDKSYLGYVGQSPIFRNYIIAHARGTANQVRMSLGLLKNMKIVLPHLSIQRRIAEILSAYDDLIENNMRRIQILEEMARRIYDEWFVRFHFPGSENIRTAESELGLIPAGFEVQSVNRIIEFDPRTTVPREGIKPFIPMASLAENSMLIASVESRNGNSGSKFKNGDTLIARITPCLENGKTGFVDFLPDDNAVAFGSTEFIVLRSKAVTPEFVYLTARSNRFRQHAIKSMSGATGRQRVRVDSFNDYLIARPNKDILDKFSELVSPTFKAIGCLAKKNANLRRTRDLLLPKLISGEIDVCNFPEPVSDNYASTALTR